MKCALSRYLPLVGHVVPTLVIGYGLVIPRSCIAGWNALSLGFGLSVAGTCVAYVLGQRAAASCANGACNHAPS
jgi:ABC-type Fe3+ transport system permease subunit